MHVRVIDELPCVGAIVHRDIYAVCLNGFFYRARKRANNFGYRCPRLL